MKLLTEAQIDEIARGNPNPRDAATATATRTHQTFNRSMNEILARIHIALKHLTAGQQVAAALALQDLSDDLSEKTHRFPGAQD